MYINSAHSVSDLITHLKKKRIYNKDSSKIFFFSVLTRTFFTSSVKLAFKDIFNERDKNCG